MKVTKATKTAVPRRPMNAGGFALTTVLSVRTIAAGSSLVCRALRTTNAAAASKASAGWQDHDVASCPRQGSHPQGDMHQTLAGGTGAGQGRGFPRLGARNPAHFSTLA
jgi:hypothetical protein